MFAIRRIEFGWMIAATLAGALCASPVFAQTGVGAKFGARDPITCASTKEPAQGPITAELAKRYFICASETAANGPLYLVGDVQVEVGPPIPFDRIAGTVREDADPNGPVYPIRGSFKKYQCDTVTTYSSLNNVGKNCYIYDSPHAVGLCYRTVFADWRCGMTDPQYRQIPNQPPPK